MSSNIFGNDPSRPDALYNSKHFRPEMPRIICPSLSTCDTERLAGVSSANNVCCPSFGFEVSDIGMAGDIGPVLAKNGLAVGFNLAEGDSPEAASCFKSEAETANS